MLDVVGIDLAIVAVEAEDVDPLGDGDAGAVAGGAGAAPGAVVLQTAVDAIRLAHIDGDGVELRDRKVLQVFPGLSFIVGVIEAAVATEDEVVRIAWIDPQGVIIDVGSLGAVAIDKRFASIVGDMELDAQDVKTLVVVWIDADLAIVEGTRHERIELLPGLPLVVGAEDAAGVAIELGVGGLALRGHARLVGLHDGEDDVRVFAIDAESASAERAVRQTGGHFLPALAAVNRLEEAGAGAGVGFGIAAGKDTAAHAVHGRIEQVRLIGIDGEVNAARCPR